MNDATHVPAVLLVGSSHDSSTILQRTLAVLAQLQQASGS
jgi:hypothetical protein